MILLAPDSRLATWDYLNTSTFGPDVAFINVSLAAVFSLYRVAPSQVALEGFSDGATYSLILGTRCTDSRSCVLLAPPLPACYEQTLSGDPQAQGPCLVTYRRRVKQAAELCCRAGAEAQIAVPLFTDLRALPA